jgi:[acyl-carrier-protein] S-malonyltransferase
MGADVYRASPAARRVYAIADAAVGFALSTLCFEGPAEALRETVNTQPAIVATSLALLAAVQEAAAADAGLAQGTQGTQDADAEPPLAAPLQPAFVAGHSVGEYAAIAASGALSIASALRLVRERGRLMHQEGTVCPSSMAAVLGLDSTALDAICAEASQRARAEHGVQAEAPDAHPGLGRVVMANDNAPGQIVISGEQRALALAMDLAREHGAKRVVPLAVSAAFHSPVMSPAARGLEAAVAAAPLHDAQEPVIANISALPLTTADELRSELARQIESPVQWTRSVEYMAAQGVSAFVEIGAGQVLSGLIKRIVKGATTLSVASAADVAPVAQQLRERLGA